MDLICIDNETPLVSETNIVPPVICAGVGVQEGGVGEIHTYPVSTHDGTAHNAWEAALQAVVAGDAILINQSLGRFDLPTVAKTWPDLIPLIFKALETEHVVCLTAREKLLNLSTHGKISLAPNPDGTWSRVKYSMKDLAMQYLGIDLSEDKDDEDSWRLHYADLEGVSLADYPQEALDYLMGDASHPIEIYHEQEARRERQEGSFVTEGFQTAVDFALSLFTNNGMLIDPAEVEVVDKMLKEELSEDRIGVLTEVGILRPPVKARPHKNGAKNADGTLKMTQAKDPTKNTKVLRKFIKDFCQEHQIRIQLTETEKVSTASGFLELLHEAEPANPVLMAYAQRQELSTLVSNYMPKLRQGGEIRAKFNSMVETGRTSSYGSKKGKAQDYLAWNGQNVDPRVRPCGIAHPGWLFFSCDLQSNELVTLAQKCFSLFGHSVMRDQANAGRDLHAYLGAQIALEKWEEFRDICTNEGYTQRTEVADAFLTLKGSAVYGKQFKLYRKLAKPVGLGYPGGLGAETFVSFARGYGVNVDVAEAKFLKEVWFETYPEMREYFDHITKVLPDEHNHKKYAYTSPFGMVRRGASWCAAANGLGLQTPPADGGKLGVYQMAKECYDPTEGSILYGTTRPLIFIHDELFGEVLDDCRQGRHDRAMRVAEIMEESMRTVVTDVRVRAEPALMDRWRKQAEPVYGADGLLDVWQPKEQL